MAKAVKAAVTVFAITTGMAFIFQSAGLFALGSFSTAGAFIGGISTTTLAMLSGASVLAQGLISRGIDAVGENFGSKVSTRSATNPRQIIYGKARVGGTITHIETSGTDNHKLSMIVALAGHEVESLEEVLINDTVLTTTTVNTFQYATNSKFINTDNDNKFDSNGTLLRYKFKDGSQTTADTSVTSNTSLTTSDKFVGVSYIFIEMVFDSEAFGGGIPPMAFVVKGKKVFDPRNNTTAWSDNPALCVRDFITDTTYGLKATTSEVNDTTALGGFKTAANTCDNGNTITTATVNGAVNNTTTVNLNNSATNTLIDVGHAVSGTGISGSPTVIKRTGNQITLSSAQTISNGVTLTFTEKAYTANGITNMSADGGGVIEGLLSSCAGKLSYVNGKFVMFAGASVTPDMTITDDNILAPITVQTAKSSGETFNQVKSVYVDANNNYVSTDSPLETTVNPVTTNTYLSEDTPTGEAQANYKKTLEVQLPFTDTTTMAQRLQRTALLHTRQKTALSVVCNIAYMQLQPFDWVYLTNERLGYTNKVFEVLATNLEVLEKSGVQVLATRLDLKEINSNVYAFASSSYTNPVDEGSSVSTGSFSVSPPTSLAVTTTLEITGHDLNVSWTNNPDDLVQGTEVFYGTSSGTYIGSFIVGKGIAKESINGVKASTTYYIAVRHFSANNVFSALTSEVTVTTGTAPISYSTGGGNVGGSDTVNILGKNLVLNRFNSTSGGEDNENYTFLNSGNGAIGGVTSFQNSDTERVQLFFGEDIGGDFTNQFIALDADWDLGKGGANGNSTGTSKLIIKGKAYGSSTGSAGATSTIATFNAITNTDGYAFPTVELAPTTISGSTTTPIVEVSQGSAPSTTTNKLYNVGGTLYWNGAVVDTGVGDITGVTITTSGQSGLTGGASFSSGDATFTLAIASTINGSKTFSDDVVVEGDLTVEGTTTTIDTTNLDVQDKNITLNYGGGDTSANANGAGITIQDAVSATQDATLTWNTANDSFNFSHNLNFADNVKAQFGTGLDLEIYHDGSNSYIKDTGEGSLKIQSSTGLALQDSSGNNFAVFTDEGTGGKVELYKSSTVRLTTTTSGIDVTGNIVADGGTIDGTFIVDGGTGVSSTGVLNVRQSGDGEGNGIAITSSHATSHRIWKNASGVLNIGSSSNTNAFQQDLTGNITIEGTINSGAITSENIDVTGASGGNGQITVARTSGSTVAIQSQSARGLIGTSTNHPFRLMSNATQRIELDTSGNFNLLSGALEIGGQTVISSARNITAGTIDSGAIDATGAITSSSALTGNRVNITDSIAPYIVFTEGSSTVHMGLDNGNFWIRQNGLSGGDEININSDGTLVVNHNSTFNGNISVTGTVDGRDIATDGTKLDGIEAGATTDQTQADINALAITEVGTITSGTWNGSVIASAYLDADTAHLSGTQTFTGDKTFADNVKAKFGTSNDLQIFHDGSNSFIKEVGTGDLRILASAKIDFRSNDDATVMIRANAGGSVDLRYAGNRKLATTSTGIDVTGTVTSDGIGLAAGSSISSAGGLIVTIDDDNTSGSTYFEINADGTSKSIARFVENGDISFYEDTGTTAKLFWDASTERLGIGTASPQAKLESYVSGNFSTTYNDFSGDGLYIQTNGTVADGEYTSGISFSRTAGNNARVAGIAGVQEGSDADKTGLAFFTHPSTGTADALQESLRISADGSIGIGTSSPTNGNLQIGDSDADFNIAVAGARTKFGYDSSNNSTVVQGGITKGIIFCVNNSTFGSGVAGRFDASGNLLVGTTSTTPAFGTGNGTAIRTGEMSHISRSGGTALALNRASSDGDIVSFRKDGTQVGSIGTYSGNPYIESSSNFSLMLVSSDIRPRTVGGTSNNDGTIDLGVSSSRFKDLHLSGTANVNTIASTGDLTLDATGDINLDAEGNDIKLKDGGTEFGRLSNSSLSLQIFSPQPNADINFVGNDDGSTITALALNMSAGGSATFNNDVSVTNELNVGQQITASGGITTDQTGQTISGFSTIRVGDALIGQDVATLTTTATTQTNRILASATTYRTIKVLVQIKSSTNFHATEILLTHNGTTVYMTEYATIFSNNSLATFDADISGGNIRLLIDPNQSASTEFKFNVSGIEA